MANFVSIGAITKILRFIIQKNIDNDLALEEGGESVNVTSKPLSEIPIGTNDGVNIFLYQVVPNSAYRNSDLPFRDSNGAINKKKIFTGIDLNYLITAYCRKMDNDDVNIIDQKSLASVISTLHENGIISKKMIRSIIFDADDRPRSGFEDVQKMNIDKQVEHIRITLNNLSLDDMTKLWSSFAKDVPYAISISLNVGVIILDKIFSTSEPIPVQERKLYVNQNKKPHILSVEPRQVEYSEEPEITISGKNLYAEEVVLDFGFGMNVDEMPKLVPRADGKLIANIIPDPKTNKIPLGPRTVQIVHPLSIGKPESKHIGLKSNISLFEVVPKILDHAKSDTQPNLVHLNVAPEILADDDVYILLGTFRPIPASLKEEETSSKEIDFLIPEFPDEYMNHNYPLRIQINGVTSLITIDDNPDSIDYGRIVPYLRLE